jgi:germination protein M
MIETGMKKKKRVSSSTLGCLFWAALAVVLVAVALAVREPVLRNVRRLLGMPSTEDAGTAEAPARQPAAVSPPAPPPSSAGTAATRPAPTAPSAADGEPAADTTPPAVTASPKPGVSPPAMAAQPSPAAPAAGAVRTRATRLWFVKVDREGAIELAPASRSLPVGDSPLRDNLASLLAGPTATEREAGLVSLIPTGTAVRSVTVKGDTATIDFSEQFRFTTLGIEGLRAQLRQVVWAATEFPTVSRVQVLIEGQRVDYLGPEGAAVGSPLGRDSDFQ